MTREVPLAFPLAAADSCAAGDNGADTTGCRYYTLSSDEVSLDQRLSDNDHSTTTTTAVVPRYREQNKHVASVSDIGNGTLVTVAPAAGEACLSVTLLRGLREPRVVQLDFHTVAPMIPLVATKAMRVPTTNQTELFQLIILNANPTAFTIWFDVETLTPQVIPGAPSRSKQPTNYCVRTTHIRNALVSTYDDSNAASTTSTTSASSLDHNRVGFLGPDRLLLALYDELLAYDLATDDFLHWSESVATSYTATHTSWFAAATAALLPPLDPASMRWSDRQPIAALHVVDGTLVFCVHADGSLHQWTVDTKQHNSLRPASYRALPPNDAVPPYDTWESIALTAATYPLSDMWCWILYFQCHTPIPYTDTATPLSLTQSPTQEAPNPHVLLAITGRMEDTTTTSGTSTAEHSTISTLRLVTQPYPITQLLLTTPACRLITAVQRDGTSGSSSSSSSNPYTSSHHHSSNNSHDVSWWTYPQGVSSSMIQLDATETTEQFLEGQGTYRVLRPTGLALPPRAAVLHVAQKRSQSVLVRRRRPGTPRRRRRAPTLETGPSTTNDDDNDTTAIDAQWDALIAKEEVTERSVVALGMATTTSAVQDSTIVVVRPCSTAVLVPQQRSQAAAALSEEHRLIQEFDRIALEHAAEFADDLQVLKDAVWKVVSQGRLVLDYATTIEPCQQTVFRLFAEEYHVELPKKIQRAIEKQYDAFVQTLADLPPEWYTQFLSESGDATGNYQPTPSPPLGFHGRLAASSCTIRVLEDACHLFLARSLILSGAVRSSTRGRRPENLHVYLLAVSALHMATTTTTAQLSTGTAMTMPPTSPLSGNAGLASKTFLDTFLAHRSSQTQEMLTKPCSYAGLTLHWTMRSFLSLLGASVDPADPVFSLVAPNGNIPDPHLALCCLAPHACLAQNDASVALLTARCLLRVAAKQTNDDGVAQTMAQRAFQLLKEQESSDSTDAAAVGYIDKLLIVENEIDATNRVVARAFFDLTQQLSEQLEHSSIGDTAVPYQKLWTASFRAAIKTGEFAHALLNCKSHPDLHTRFAMAKELVVSMLHQGALGRLCELCAASHCEEDFARGTNMYGVAEVTIQELIDDSGDFYTASVLSGSGAPPPHDYSMDLQCIHMKAGTWKKVASCWNDRYNQALHALRSRDPMVLSPIQREEREGLIVADLARAASTVKMAMLQLDSDEQLLVAYTDRNRWAPVRSDLLPHKSSTGSRAKGKHLRWNMVGLELRSERASGLRRLWKLDSSFVVEAFQSEDISDAQVMDRLCLHGLYSNALRLGSAADNVRPGELNQLLCHLCVTYLVPLMTPKVQKPDRIPSLEQIADAVQYLRRTTSANDAEQCVNFSIARQGGRSRKADSTLVMIQTATEVLVQMLLKAFGGRDHRFYEDIAMTMLITHKYKCLPAWLESFMLFGTAPEADLPGLFARRRSPETTYAFLGHPDGLLNIYMHSCRYADAARIVCVVLQGASTAIDRLPEQGSIDWVPGATIKLLWQKLEGILLHHKGSTHTVREHPKYITRIQQARDELKAALEQYSELVQLREEGLRAARALAT